MLQQILASGSFSVLACCIFSCCTFACCLFACCFAWRGASLQLRTWKFIVWRVGPHGCLPSSPPFSKHLHLSWSSFIFGDVTRGRLTWLPSLICILPTFANTCFAVNWHLPSIFDYCLINKLTSIFSITGRQRFTNSRNFTSTV